MKLIVTDEKIICFHKMSGIRMLSLKFTTPAPGETPQNQSLISVVTDVWEQCMPYGICNACQPVLLMLCKLLSVTAPASKT